MTNQTRKSLITYAIIGTVSLMSYAVGIFLGYNIGKSIHTFVVKAADIKYS